MNNKFEDSTTYMWQEERGEPYYRFQTDDIAIAKKMRQRQGFKLVAQGFNCRLWVFSTQISRPQNARRTLKTLTGNKIAWDETTDTFYSKNSSKNLQPTLF